MDQSKVKEWVDANLKRLMDELGIPHWKITVSYEYGADEKNHQCATHPEYETGYVTLVVDDIDDLERLESVLIHELLHCVESPYCNFWRAVCPYLDTKAQDSLAEVFKTCREHSVIHLQRMRQGCLQAGYEKAKPKEESPEATRIDKGEIGKPVGGEVGKDGSGEKACAEDPAEENFSF